ncbi:hypothetical protein JX266_011546 [Neoarthrinium moseri]|nr:hypothetical protein JX266_011546 [Neoarthrinium moseri]
MAPLEKFEYFSDLPSELRQQIWFEAIPRKVIWPQGSGPAFAPRAPILASVCSEARRVVLRHGQPYAIDKKHKHPSTAWFSPKRDIVLYSYGTPGFKVNHPVCRSDLEHNARVIVVEDLWLRLQNSTQNLLGQRAVLQVVSRAIDLPHLEEIMVWPVERTCQAYYSKLCNKSAMLQSEKEWLGQDSFAVVDLSDDEDVKKAKDIYKLKLGDPFWYAHGMYAPETFTLGSSNNRPVIVPKNYWPDLIKECELAWLLANYEKQSSDKLEVRPYPIKIQSENDIDRSNAWIRTTLAKMPKLRPIHLIVDESDDSYYASDRGHLPTHLGFTRRTFRREGDAEAPYIFNNDVKMWIKHEPRPKITRKKATKTA